jgi:phenylalanyl-tRNA synthetase beta chain
MALVGLADPAHWQRERRKVDIFDLKGEVQSFLAALGLDKCRFISYSTSNSLVEEGIAIESNGGSIGFMGKARADSLNLYGIDCSVFVAELRMEFLVAQQKRRHMPVPRFPRVKRDLAFIIDRSILSETISDIILASSSGLVKKVDLFDVYEGERLPLGKKSLAFSLELTSMERTLTDEEVDHEMEKIVRAVEIGCNAVLRSSETE